MQLDSVLFIPYGDQYDDEIDAILDAAEEALRDALEDFPGLKTYAPVVAEVDDDDDADD